MAIKGDISITFTGIDITAGIKSVQLGEVVFGDVVEGLTDVVTHIYANASIPQEITLTYAIESPTLDIVQALVGKVGILAIIDDNRKWLLQNVIVASKDEGTIEKTTPQDAVFVLKGSNPAYANL